MKKGNISEILDIVDRCPHGEPDLACPLIEVRNLPEAERYKSLDSLSKELKLILMAHHRLCACQRTFFTDPNLNSLTETGKSSA